jgi:transposase-like protein
MPSRRDSWHLDEVVVTIAGQQHWLWRAVDQDDMSSTKSFRRGAIPKQRNAC